MSVLELNEAFAAQSLACLAEWTELDPERVNVNGGAIALGHPLGASGARVLATCAYELRRRGGGWGVATLCIGVGQGLAVVLEALRAPGRGLRQACAARSASNSQPDDPRARAVDRCCRA